MHILGYKRLFLAYKAETRPRNGHIWPFLAVYRPIIPYLRLFWAITGVIWGLRKYSWHTRDGLSSSQVCETLPYVDESLARMLWTYLPARLVKSRSPSTNCGSSSSLRSLWFSRTPVLSPRRSEPRDREALRYHYKAGSIPCACTVSHP